MPLIAVARSYGLVACVSGRRATTARRIVSLGSITYVGNHGAEILRGGATDVELDPEVAALGAEGPRVRRARPSRATSQRLRVRAEDKDVIRAFHWRGAPDEEAAEAAVREIAKRAEDGGPRRPTGAARCSRSVRRSSSTRAAACARCSRRRDVDAALYVGDDTHRPRRVRRAARARRARARCARRCASACARTRRRRALEEQADLLIDGPAGCPHPAERARRVGSRRVRFVGPAQDHRPPQRAAPRPRSPSSPSPAASTEGDDDAGHLRRRRGGSSPP